MIARKAAGNKTIDAIFLRPVICYAEDESKEGDSEFWRRLKRAAENGALPYIPHERRGMHQYVSRFHV